MLLWEGGEGAPRCERELGVAVDQGGGEREHVRPTAATAAAATGGGGGGDGFGAAEVLSSLWVVRRMHQAPVDVVVKVECMEGQEGHGAGRVGRVEWQEAVRERDGLEWRRGTRRVALTAIVRGKKVR